MQSVDLANLTVRLGPKADIRRFPLAFLGSEGDQGLLRGQNSLLSHWIKCQLSLSRRSELADPSPKSRKALTVSAVNRLVKKWCLEVGAHGQNFGSHTLRKTWGFHQRVVNRAPIPLLREAFGHTSQTQTLAYIGIQAEGVQALFEMEL